MKLWVSTHVELINIAVSTFFAIQKILNVAIKIIWESQMIELVI